MSGEYQDAVDSLRESWGGGQSGQCECRETHGSNAQVSLIQYEAGNGNGLDRLMLKSRNASQSVSRRKKQNQRERRERERIRKSYERFQIELISFFIQMA